MLADTFYGVDFYGTNGVVEVTRPALRTRKLIASLIFALAPRSGVTSHHRLSRPSSLRGHRGPPNSPDPRTNPPDEEVPIRRQWKERPPPHDPTMPKMLSCVDSPEDAVSLTEQVTKVVAGSPWCARGASCARVATSGTGRAAARAPDARSRSSTGDSVRTSRGRSHGRCSAAPSHPVRQ